MTFCGKSVFQSRNVIPVPFLILSLVVLASRSDAELTSMECGAYVSIGTGTPFPALNRLGEGKLLRWGLLNTNGECVYQFSCLIDAGVGVTLGLFQHGTQSYEVSCVIYTHGHFDHIFDLPLLSYTNGLNAGTAVPKLVPVFGPHSAFKAINDSLYTGVLAKDKEMRTIGVFGPNFTPGFIDYTTYMANKDIAAGFPIVPVWPRPSGLGSHNASFLGSATIDLQNTPHTDFTGFSAATNSKNALFVNETSVSIRVRVAGWTFVFAGDMGNRADLAPAPPGGAGPAFQFGNGLDNLAAGADVLQIHPYYDSPCDAGCASCIPPSFPFLHSATTRAAVQTRRINVPITVLSHPNPPSGKDVVRIGSSGLWDPDVAPSGAPETPNRDALAPFLPKFSRPITMQDYTTCLRNDGAGNRNEIISADEDRDAEIDFIDMRATAIWVVDAVSGADLFPLQHLDVLNVDTVKTTYGASMLSLRAQVTAGSPGYVSYVSWLVDGVAPEDGLNTDYETPFCINSARDGGTGPAGCLPSELLEAGRIPLGAPSGWATSGYEVTLMVNPYWKAPSDKVFRGAPLAMTITLVPASHPDGCADGSREGFTNLGVFPDIAACSGSWQRHGVALGHNLVPTCDLQFSETGPHDDGQGQNCSAADLCERGWHVCDSNEDVIDSAGPGTGGGGSGALGCLASGADFPAGTFYATRISGPGDGKCDAGDAQWRNDVFGCGTRGSNLLPDPAAASCTGLNKFSHNTCSTLTAGSNPGEWQCDHDQNGVVNGAEPWEEAAEVTHRTSLAAPGTQGGGGVMCCRGYMSVQNATTTVHVGPVCEGGYLHLTCPSHRVIRVVSGSFGRSDDSICSDPGRFSVGYTTGQCAADSLVVHQVLVEECNDKTSCSLLVSVPTFGAVDPCLYTVKYAEALYKCEIAP